MIQDGEVLHGHSERYSGVKNDSDLNRQLISDCFRYGKNDKVYILRKTILEKTQTTQVSMVKSYQKVIYHQITSKNGLVINRYIMFNIINLMAGYYTSPYEES